MIGMPAVTKKRTERGTADEMAVRHEGRRIGATHRVMTPKGRLTSGSKRMSASRQCMIRRKAMVGEASAGIIMERRIGKVASARRGCMRGEVRPRSKMRRAMDAMRMRSEMWRRMEMGRSAEMWRGVEMRGCTEVRRGMRSAKMWRGKMRCAAAAGMTAPGMPAACGMSAGWFRQR